MAAHSWRPLLTAGVCRRGGYGAPGRRLAAAVPCATPFTHPRCPRTSRMPRRAEPHCMRLKACLPQASTCSSAAHCWRTCRANCAPACTVCSQRETTWPLHFRCAPAKGACVRWVRCTAASTQMQIVLCACAARACGVRAARKLRAERSAKERVRCCTPHHQAQLMEQIAPGTAPSSDSAASQRAASSSTAGRGEEAADDASCIVPPPVGANGHSPHLQQQQLPRPQAGGLSAFSGSLGPTAADPTVGTSSNGPPEATGAGAAQGTSVGAAPSLLAPRPPYSEAALLQAMHEVPWDAAAGRPMPMSDGALAQLAAAQHVAALQRCVGGLERVDDIIARGEPA